MVSCITGKSVSENIFQKTAEVLSPLDVVERLVTAGLAPVLQVEAVPWSRLSIVFATGLCEVKSAWHLPPLAHPSIL